MNPFLQRNWSDVHLALIGFIRAALSEELPPDLAVRGEERVTVAANGHHYRSDVAVVEPWRDGFPPVWTPESTGEPILTVTEPIVVMVEPEIERWLEVRDSNGRLITVIEVISPTNKSDQGWRAYRQKQEDFLAAGVNLIEIDLIRGGQHVLAVPLDAFPRPPGACHLICVARQQPGYTSRREVYPSPMREPLPTIRVPLRPGEADVPLALQPLIDRVYRSGRYWLGDHGRELAPPLTPEDAAWVSGRLQAAGLKDGP